MMLNGNDVTKLRGEFWASDFSEKDIVSIFDENGPLQAVVHGSSFSLSWFVQKVFNNKQGKPLELQPFQMVLIDMLWKKKFPMVLGSRGCGKTYILALYACLRALLIPGSRIVICGAGFRQAKLVFNYILDLYNASPIFQEACADRPKFGSDTAYLDIGLSKITAIPIGDGERIRGLRACVDPNTIIETDKGLVRIKDSFDLDNGKDFKVYTGNKSNLVQPTHFVKTRPIDAYTVKTIGNYEFTCSDIHKVYTEEGFKYAKDLTKDDKLEFANNYKFPKEYVNFNGGRLDEDLAWCLGLLISEGSVSDSCSAQVNMTDKETLERYGKIMRTHGLNICEYYHKPRYDERGWTSKESWVYSFCNKKFRAKLFKELDLKFHKARDKSVPSSILASPESVVKSFLSGLFNGDGSAFLYKDKKRDNNFGITYYTGSKQLAIDVQVLLAKFDIFSTKGYRNGSNLSDKIQYHIRLYGRSTFETYDILDVPKWKDTYDNSFKGTKFIPKRKFLQVKTVEKLEGKHVLYDYTVPDDHSFMGNCFRQHNTVLLCDEFASIPEDIFDIVLKPFTAVHANPAERANMKRFLKRLKKLGADDDLIEKIDTIQGFGNQIVISGTASFKHNHFYKRYSTYKNFISSRGDAKKLKNALEEQELSSTGRINEISPEDINNMVKMWTHYAVYQLPYHGIPDGFMDEDQIRSDKANMPSYRFALEYEAKFPDDSDGFIKRSWVHSATPSRGNPDDPHVPVELYGNARHTYVMGVDPARYNDNLGVVVLKITPRGRELVYCNAWDKTEWQKSAMMIRNICKAFNIQYIAMDKGGGGDSLIEWLSKKMPEVNDSDLIWPIKDQLENPADISAPGRKVVELVNFSSTWTSSAAHNLEASITQRNLLFPIGGDEGEVIEQYKLHFGLDNISDEERKLILQDLWGVDSFEAEQNGSERKLGISNQIDDCLNETCAIMRDVTDSGIERFILPKLSEQPEGLDMRRRDRFSALMLANYAAKVYEGHGHKPVHNPGIGAGGGNRRRSRTGGRFRRRGSVAF